MSKYTIKIQQNQEGYYEAVALLPHNKIKGIVGITHEETMVKARLSILKFLITTRKEPLIITENNHWLITGNYAAKKILGTIAPKELATIKCPLEIVSEIYIPQPMQVFRLLNR
jgi:hypothetical protein